MEKAAVAVLDVLTNSEFRKHGRVLYLTRERREKKSHSSLGEQKKQRTNKGRRAVLCPLSEILVFLLPSYFISLLLQGLEAESNSTPLSFPAWDVDEWMDPARVRSTSPARA
jgi:hypothetical protein